MSLEPKRILVTGATGFIGSNLVRKLLLNNYQVHILKRKNSDTWRIKDILTKLKIHNVDLLEKEKLWNAVHKISPNVIFHLANLGLYGEVDPKLENSIKVNLLGTINLIESLGSIDYECFINTGSSSEYGIKSRPMKETDICEPMSNYALSKLATTLYVQRYAKNQRKPLATFRIFSPFGPYDSPERFITQMILKVIKGKKFLSNNPYSTRDYIFIDDVIDAYLLSMKKGQKLCGEIFNIGSGKESRIKDVVELLEIEMSSKLVSFNKTSKKNNTVWQADNKKAKKILQWYPAEKLTTGLKKTVAWFKENHNLYE